jgi:hypothetical protein
MHEEKEEKLAIVKQEISDRKQVLLNLIGRLWEVKGSI